MIKFTAAGEQVARRDHRSRGPRRWIREAIIETYLSGHTMKETAKTEGLTCSVVSGVLIRAKVPRRSKGPRPHKTNSVLIARNHNIIDAYLSGQSLAVVGKTVGLTRERIRQILVTASIPTRRYTPRTKFTFPEDK